MSIEYAPDGSIVVHHDRCSWTAVHGKEAPSPEPWDRSWTFLCCCDVIQGVESEIRALTLDAAQEAVAAALAKGLATSTDGALYFFELSGDPDFPNNGYYVTFRKDSLIAAIDALRKQP